MDLVLILIILAITVVIGYVLSRPFLNPEISEVVLGGVESDLQEKYQTLLKEIKVLENAYEVGNLDKEAFLHQRDEKRFQAAECLREIERIAGETPQEDFKTEKAGGDSPASPSPQHTKICPHCGNSVLSGDKFCANCGHNLQP
jgi:hypothetical protein